MGTDWPKLAVGLFQPFHEAFGGPLYDKLRSNPFTNNHWIRVEPVGYPHLNKNIIII